MGSWKKHYNFVVIIVGINFFLPFSPFVDPIFFVLIIFWPLLLILLIKSFSIQKNNNGNSALISLVRGFSSYPISSILYLTIFSSAFLVLGSPVANIPLNKNVFLKAFFLGGILNVLTFLFMFNSEKEKEKKQEFAKKRKELNEDWKELGNDITKRARGEDEIKALSEKYGIEEFIVQSIVNQYKKSEIYKTLRATDTPKDNSLLSSITTGLVTGLVVSDVDWAEVEKMVVEHKKGLPQQLEKARPRTQAEKNDELQRMRKKTIESIDNNLNRELLDVDEQVRKGDLQLEEGEIEKDNRKAFWNRKKMTDLEKLERKYR